MAIVMRTTASLCASAAMLPSVATAQPVDAWQFEASLYLYLPSVDGKTTFPQGPLVVEAKNILNSLQGAFMGSFEARRGPWGGFTDFVYVDFGQSKSGTRDLSVGGVPLPVDVSANLSLDLKGVAWTVAGTYRAVPDPISPVDVFAGARLLDIKQSVAWQLSGNLGPISPPGRGGNQEVHVRNWDAIVGVKGRLGFGAERKWFAPYYLDVGTGNSDLTWQATAGVGYAFRWGDVVASWRYLEYRPGGGKEVEKLSFSGPAVSAVFHW